MIPSCIAKSVVESGNDALLASLVSLPAIQQQLTALDSELPQTLRGLLLAAEMMDGGGKRRRR